MIRRLLLRSLELRPVQHLLRPTLRRAMPIFMFHRFAQPDLGIRGDAPAELRRQLATLRQRGVRFVSLPELVARDPDHVPRTLEVAFTVDDGYADFKDVALPIFQEFDCPVSVFISTGVIDGAHWYWWDQLTHVFMHSPRREVRVSLGERLVTYQLDDGNRERLAAEVTEIFKTIRHELRLELMRDIATALEVEVPVTRPAAYATLTWQDVAASAATGLVSFGPHTITHPALTQTSAAMAREEIIGSWERLKQCAPDPLPIFCYPFGLYARRDVEILETTEMVGAITTDARYASRMPFARARGTARFEVPRFAYPDNAVQFQQVAMGVERLKMLIRHGRAGWSTDAPA